MKAPWGTPRWVVLGIHRSFTIHPQGYPQSLWITLLGEANGSGRNGPLGEPWPGGDFRSGTRFPVLRGALPNPCSMVPAPAEAESGARGILVIRSRGEAESGNRQIGRASCR